MTWVKVLAFEGMCGGQFKTCPIGHKGETQMSLCDCDKCTAGRGSPRAKAVAEAIRALGDLIIGGHMSGQWPQPQLEEIRNNLMKVQS